MKKVSIDQIIKFIRELSFLAFYDPLTKCLNRRGFGEQIKELGVFSKAKTIERRRKKNALILIDANKFKQINDNFGYQIGDRVLKIIASVLKNNFRKEDIVCRWGGDEFLIIMHAVKENKVKEKLKEAKRKIDKKLKKYNSGITFAYSMFANGANFKKVFNQVNKELKKLKKNG
jgi:diguanylate cyclase (GGDEF)-like protein